MHLGWRPDHEIASVVDPYHSPSAWRGPCDERRLQNLTLVTRTTAQACRTDVPQRGGRAPARMET
jgi:hypothetical protein